MKIVTVVGARPQFIKAATVSAAIIKKNSHLREDGISINEVVIHTGQHYDTEMSDVFFKELNIPSPTYNLDINGVSHGEMTGRMLIEIETILLDEEPDFVLVYGDTNSTLAGSLAASKLHIPVVHVEAGLRSYNRNMPEEINRVLTDQLASILFCPTQESITNLENEGIADKKDGRTVKLVGDVMYDATLSFLAYSNSETIDTSKPYILATMHRQENTESKKRLCSIIDSLNELGKKTRIVFPIHPRTRNKLELYGIKVNPQIEIVEPVSYLTMLDLLKNCLLVITDSGGLQKEAYFSGKFCLTLREETEWVELVESGVNALVGADCDRIIQKGRQYLGRKVETQHGFYGKGDAAIRIVDCLLDTI